MVDEQRRVYETFHAERYGVGIIHATGNMLVNHVPHAEHVESLIRRNGEVY